MIRTSTAPRSLVLCTLALLPLVATLWLVPTATTASTANETDCCAKPEELPGNGAAASSSPDARARQAQVRIPDKQLLDQNGEQVRLFTDLIQGKKVIINFVFTTCTSVCPTLQAVFEGVQERLGDRLGSEVNLISISVDPGNDTPERLKAFAADYHAKPGWSFLTGDIEDVNEVLQAFGVLTRTKEEHSSMFVLGHEATGRWMYMSGFVDPRTVIKQLETLCSAK